MPLLARYDLPLVQKSLTRESLEHRAPGLWRFRELLPVRNEDFIVSLGEHMTPIIPLQRIGRELDLSRLFLKDEGLLPTGSFKARGAAVGVSRAKELGVSALAMPSNGNAGIAWSMFAARAGISAVIVLPALAPSYYRAACALAGAKVFLIDGLIGDASRAVRNAAARNGLYNASTMLEPYRVEGKKTMGFEIAEQFDWDLPDVIIYPTGGGVGLIGMHKAFCELREIGLLPDRMPRFVAVQSSGCAPIVAAWRERRETSTPWQGAATVAFGINVPKALGDFLILRILYETEGCAVAVDDDAILEYQRLLMSQEGVLACPEGAATLAAAGLLRTEGLIGADQRVLIVNTGSGALFPDVPCPALEAIGARDELPLSPYI
jgi:threonine synthase